MTTGHSHPNEHPPTHGHLHVPGDSIVHQLAAPTKLVSLVVAAVALALTPIATWWAFALDAFVLMVIIISARLPLRVVLVRLVIVLPFLGFAALLPFIGESDSVTAVGPLELATEGLRAGASIMAKALIGATASIIVAATTPLADIIDGLAKLRLPAVVVGIVAFMFRYLDLLADGLQRMRQAMIARAHDPRWLWQVKPIAQSAGVLFVRTYERGERVHLAMLSRGFTGKMPNLRAASTPVTDWIWALAPAAVFVAGAGGTLLL